MITLAFLLRMVESPWNTKESFFFKLVNIPCITLRGACKIYIAEIHA